MCLKEGVYKCEPYRVGLECRREEAAQTMGANAGGEREQDLVYHGTPATLEDLEVNTKSKPTSVSRMELLQRTEQARMALLSDLPPEIKLLFKRALDKGEAALGLQEAMARKAQREKKLDVIHLPAANTVLKGRVEQPTTLTEAERRPCTGTMKSTWDKFKIIVRWSIFAPAALVASVLAGGIVKYTLPFVPFPDIDIDDTSVASHASVDAIVGLAMGAAFVYIGARIAPSHKQVAYVLLAIMLVTIGMTIHSAVLSHSYWAVWSSIFSALAGLSIAIAASKGELNLD
jgi:hypothetical protein